MVEGEAAVLERGDHPAQRPGLAEQQVHAAADDLVVDDLAQRAARRARAPPRGRRSRSRAARGRRRARRRAAARRATPAGPRCAPDRARAEVRLGGRELAAREVASRPGGVSSTASSSSSAAALGAPRARARGQLGRAPLRPRRQAGRRKREMAGARLGAPLDRASCRWICLRSAPSCSDTAEASSACTNRIRSPCRSSSSASIAASRWRPRRERPREGVRLSDPTTRRATTLVRRRSATRRATAAPPARHRSRRARASSSAVERIAAARIMDAEKLGPRQRDVELRATRWIAASLSDRRTGVRLERTTLPSSIFSCRALASSVRLIASQVSARIALIVLCSTDFFGLQGHGSRAKARNDAESSRWKANSS